MRPLTNLLWTFVSNDAVHQSPLATMRAINLRFTLHRRMVSLLYFMRFTNTRYVCVYVCTYNMYITLPTS